MDNEAIKKLKSNIPLNKEDIKELEKVLWSELGTKEEYEQEYGQKPLGKLVREIVGLDMNAAKEAFSAYLENSNLDSRQIYFVNQIVEYIVRNGMMKDLSVLQEAPFTDQGSIVEIFTDLGVWANIKSIIDRINENAAA
jgi:putative type I restriction-modification system, R subunit